MLIDMKSAEAEMRLCYARTPALPPSHPLLQKAGEHRINFRSRRAQDTLSLRAVRLKLHRLVVQLRVTIAVSASVFLVFACLASFTLQPCFAPDVTQTHTSRFTDSAASMPQSRHLLPLLAPV